MSSVNQGIDSQGFPRVIDVDNRRRTQVADRELYDDLVPVLADILAEVRMMRTGAVISGIVQDVAPGDVL